MGRPPGSYNRPKPFATLLREALLANDMARLRRLVEKLISMAQAGNVDAFKEIANRLDGRVPLAIEASTERTVMNITWTQPKPPAIEPKTVVDVIELPNPLPDYTPQPNAAHEGEDFPETDAETGPAARRPGNGT